MRSTIIGAVILDLRRTQIRMTRTNGTLGRAWIAEEAEERAAQRPERCSPFFRFGFGEAATEADVGDAKLTYEDLCQGSRRRRVSAPFGRAT